MRNGAANGSAALAGLLILGVGAAPAYGAPDWAAKGTTIEKCAGVAKAAKNDCGTSTHDCAGKAAKNDDPEEWVYVPSGVCEKLAGAKLKETKKVE